MTIRRNPTGVGLYYRALDGRPEVARDAAVKAADHGLSFVALAGVWQEATGERDIAKTEAEMRWAFEFKKWDIDVWVWGYPHAGHEARFLTVMHDHVKRLGASGILLDPEKSYKNDVVHAEKLCEMTVDSLNESLGLGVTTFGNPKALAPAVRKVFASYGWCSPQVYTVEPWMARDLVEEWIKLGGTHMVPSVPTYGPQSGGNLGAYIGAFEDLCEGVIAWSANSIDDREWKALERWATRF